MILKKIDVFHFRNFKNKTFYFNPFLTLVVGPNSAGKTNLLEAVFFLLQAKGIKDEKNENLIQLGEKQTSINAYFQEDSKNILVRCELFKNEGVEKKFYVNKVKKTLQNYNEHIPPAVIFNPELIEEITTEPSRRRRYFDLIISRIDKTYQKNLIEYSRGLYKRNRILEQNKSIYEIEKELIFWNNFISVYADMIQKKRAEFVEFLSLNDKLSEYSFSVEYKKSNISIDILQKTLNDQIKYRSTLVGPQRDDYEFFFNVNNERLSLNKYGSRSQQRLALLWIILSTIKLYTEKLKIRPILLLDDIFSELDSKNIKIVLNVVRKHQTIITSSLPFIVEKIDMPNSIIVLK